MRRHQQKTCPLEKSHGITAKRILKSRKPGTGVQYYKLEDEEKSEEDEESRERQKEKEKEKINEGKR